MIDEIARAGARPPSERLIWTLGLGSLGLAWAISTVAAYLPFVLARFTSANSLIGLTLAAEGVFALILPLMFGPLSEASRTRGGRRRPYLVLAVGPLVLTLAALPVMPTFAATAALLLLFYFAYYLYETPYRALYPDVLGEAVMGRAQAAAHVLRGLAMAGALVGGGVALAAWRPLPFLIAAGVTAVACVLVPLRVAEHEMATAPPQRLRSQLAASRRLLRESPALRRFLVANTAWETTFAGMRTFVVLYVVRGLEQPLSVASGVLAAVTVGYLLAAVVLGPFADHLGIGRVIAGASVVYGFGLVAGGFATRWHTWYYGLILVVAIAAGAVMVLAWALLFKLVGPNDHGPAVGLAIATRGIGLLVGPPIVGLAVDVFHPLLEETSGYAVVWPTVALPILAVIPLVLWLARAEGRSGG